jgi:excisionase family DNA binding protein
MTRKETMAYLKVGHAKFQDFVNAGMPFVMFGRQKRYRAEDIDEWLKGGGGDFSEPAGRGDTGDGESET